MQISTYTSCAFENYQHPIGQEMSTQRQMLSAFLITAATHQTATDLKETSCSNVQSRHYAPTSTPNNVFLTLCLGRAHPSLTLTFPIEHVPRHTSLTQTSAWHKPHLDKIQTITRPLNSQNKSRKDRPLSCCFMAQRVTQLPTVNRYHPYSNWM